MSKCWPTWARWPSPCWRGRPGGSWCWSACPSCWRPAAARGWRAPGRCSLQWGQDIINNVESFILVSSMSYPFYTLLWIPGLAPSQAWTPWWWWAGWRRRWRRDLGHRPEMVWAQINKMFSLKAEAMFVRNVVISGQFLAGPGGHTSWPAAAPALTSGWSPLCHRHSCVCNRSVAMFCSFSRFLQKLEKTLNIGQLTQVCHICDTSRRSFHAQSQSWSVWSSGSLCSSLKLVEQVF